MQFIKFKSQFSFSHLNLSLVFSPTPHTRRDRCELFSGDSSIWSCMTAQSGHVKSVRSITGVSQDCRPNLPDVCLPRGGYAPSDGTENHKHVHFQPQTFTTMHLGALRHGMEMKTSSLAWNDGSKLIFCWCKALHMNATHSLSLAAISGSHSKVFLMTHKH